MKYLLGALLVANCLYFTGMALWLPANVERPQPPPPLTAPAVKLLSEVAHADPVGSAAHLALEPEVPASVPDACLVSAPITDRARAESIMAAIASDDTRVQMVEVEAPDSDHLVYIPAPADRAEGRRICAKLTDRGFECHEIPTGARAGDLSVGVFSRREGAERQLARVAKLGFTTHMAPLAPVAYRLVSSAAPQGVPAAALDWSPCPAIADLGTLL